MIELKGHDMSRIALASRDEEEYLKKLISQAGSVILKYVLVRDQNEMRNLLLFMTTYQIPGLQDDTWEW